MKDIIFGMAVGGIIGILLYKNQPCAKEVFDQAEKKVMEEIEKMEKPMQKNQKNNQNK